MWLISLIFKLIKKWWCWNKKYSYITALSSEFSGFSLLPPFSISDKSVRTKQLERERRKGFCPKGVK